ncbi:wax ester/triacylglycerol synthase domain-containing protein [Nocardia brasiliensis]
MTEYRAGLRLTELDCVHLRLDSAGHPMHWLLALRLEPGTPIALDRLRSRVAARAREHVLYRLCLPERPRRRPAFVPAADPAVRVRHTAVPDRSGLLRSIEQLMATALPRSAPPWDITLVDEADRGGQTVLLRVHHCLSDGLAAPGFAALVVDTDTARDYDRFVTAQRFPFKRVLTWRTCTEVPRQYRAARPLRRAGRVLPFPPADCARQVAEFSIPIRTLRQHAADALGSSTEYLLAAAAAAYRQMIPGTDRDGLRVMVPVTLDAAARHTGNATVSAFLAVDPPGPGTTDQVRRVRERLAAVDPVDQGRALASAGVDLQYLPWRAQTRLMARMVRDTCRLSVSVTPGFAMRRTVFGHGVDATVPFSPLMADELMVTALILRDRLTVGVVADPRVLPCAVADFAERLRALLWSPV